MQDDFVGHVVRAVLAAVAAGVALGTVWAALAPWGSTGRRRRHRGEPLRPPLDQLIDLHLGRDRELHMAAKRPLG